MKRYHAQWKGIIAEAVQGLSGQEIPADSVVSETPPRPELGDIAFPMFPYARLLRRGPAPPGPSRSPARRKRRDPT
jgi:arginyl-tRNA synthetase